MLSKGVVKLVGLHEQVLELEKKLKDQLQGSESQSTILKDKVVNN